MKKTIRLDKMLGHLGYGTRSGIKLLVRQGAVFVNGKQAKDPGMQIDPAADTVVLDGETIRYREFVYVLLHKPAGYVSATEDARDRTVLDLLDEDMAAFDPFPVGRLDKDTEGLLLLTNDGKLAHELLSPRRHVPKTYRALVAGEVGEDNIAAFRQGVTLDDGYVTMPSVLRVLASASGAAARLDAEMAEALRRLDDRRRGEAAGGPLSWIELTIHEGKFHQVKRMFEAVGRRVLYLRRVAMGTLELDAALAPGEWRELTEEELGRLKNGRREETT